MKFLPYHLLLLLSVTRLAQGAITVSSGSEDGWTPIGGNFDFDDQPPGQAAVEIIGSGANYGFLVGLENNSDLYFRVRFDSPDSGNTFAGVLWVGMDADGNGSIDVFMGADFSGTPDVIGVFAPGNDENISPSTTSISSTPAYSYTISSSNYNYRPVDLNIDGGDDLDIGNNGSTDYYVSFMVLFTDVQAFLSGLTNPINITDQSPVRYVLATGSSSQLNKDVGGINGAPGNNTRWEDQGGFTAEITPGGAAIPEPSSGLLALGSLAGFLLIFRRR